MTPSLSFSREEESLAAKARWFQSLTEQERLEHLVEMTELLLTLNPDIIERKDAHPIPGRILVLERPRL